MPTSHGPETVTVAVPQPKLDTSPDPRCAEVRTPARALERMMLAVSGTSRQEPTAPRRSALPPNGSLLHLERGKAQAELGRHEDAIAGFDRSIGIDPSNLTAYLSRC